MSIKSYCPIQCVETGLNYKSISNAISDTKIARFKIKKDLRSGNNKATKFHWRKINLNENVVFELIKPTARCIRYGAEYYDKHYYPLAKNCNYILYDIVGGKYQVFFKSCGLRYIHVEVCVLPIFGDKRKTFFFTYDIFNKRFTTNVSDNPMALTYVPNLYTAICNCVSSLI